MTVYFSDTATTADQLPYVWSMRNEEFARTFPGIRGLRFARLVGKDAAGNLRPATITTRGAVKPLSASIFGPADRVRIK